MRDEPKILTHSVTAAEMDLPQSFPVTKPRARQLSNAEDDSDSKMKRVTSLPNMTGLARTPFYIQMGVVPRELKNGKIVKLAEDIKLVPESQQLLRGKIVYFYPNDDVSMVRRTRIHKVIQLGAAWVNKWRDDITHVLVDGANHTYTQLLRHLNRAGFPVRSS
jgi:DNA polymerase IV